MDVTIKQIASCSVCRSLKCQSPYKVRSNKNDRVDMGLFAIAFASILAFGNNSNNISYEENFLWPYLVQYLEKKNKEKFPMTQKKSRLL